MLPAAIVFTFLGCCIEYRKIGPSLDTNSGAKPHNYGLLHAFHKLHFGLDSSGHTSVKTVNMVSVDSDVVASGYSRKNRCDLTDLCIKSNILLVTILAYILLYEWQQTSSTVISRPRTIIPGNSTGKFCKNYLSHSKLYKPD